MVKKKIIFINSFDLAEQLSWSERTTHIRDVGGSNPSSATIATLDLFEYIFLVVTYLVLIKIKIYVKQIIQTQFYKKN